MLRLVFLSSLLVWCLMAPVVLAQQKQLTLAIVSRGVGSSIGLPLVSSNVDFGENPSLNTDSVLTAAQLPLRISASEGPSDYFIFPVCVESVNGSAEKSFFGLQPSAACIAGSNSVDLTILIRFKAKWEAFFHARVWQDPQYSPALLDAWQSLFQNSSSVPAPVSDSSRARRELEKSCNDLADECVQSKTLTYTRSYKDLGSGDVARIILPLTHADNDLPWTLRLSHSLPDDAIAILEIVVVTSAPRFSYSMRVFLAVAMNIAAVFVVAASLVAMKSSGSRFAIREGAAERRTGLYDSDDAQHRGRSFCGEMEFLWRHTWATVVEMAKKRRLVPSVEDDGRELQTVPQTSADEEPQDSPNSSDIPCRICQSVAPKEDLFAPCRCDGTCKFVHRSCLETWRLTTTNPEHRKVCAECKAPYKIVVSYGTASMTFGTLCSESCRRISVVLSVLTAAAVSAYVLKAIFALVTLDSYVIWDAMNFYHFFLGFTFMAAICCHVTGLEFFIKDFPSYLTQQLPIILLSSILYEIILGYAAQGLLAVLFQGWVTPEVSYGLGFIYVLLLAVFVGERLETFVGLQAQELVASR
jgi:hypothetical protein